jgi:GH24 family phage-related lysozyme (muramidase)
MSRLNMSMKDKIQQIQKFFNISADGIFGQKTIIEISKVFGCDSTIESIQKFIQVKPDGVVGDVTLSAILNKLNINESITLDTSAISQKAINLILESEGIDQPSIWPGGSSGITLGYGVDIGADPSSLNHWVGILSDDDIQLLQIAKGKTGTEASTIKSKFKNIKVTKEQSLKVFKTKTLPIEIQKTTKAFPGVDTLPNEILGPLVSLVYNRGTDLSGSRRAEMKEIHDIIYNYSTFSEDQRKLKLNQTVISISEQFKKMKRLWIGKGLDGLLVRRDAEASLCLEAIKN